jgi:hypothetical protein
MMLAWIKRTVMYLWRVLDSMAESAGPDDYALQRISKLEARIARLEGGAALSAEMAP